MTPRNDTSPESSVPWLGPEETTHAGSAHDTSAPLDDTRALELEGGSKKERVLSTEPHRRPVLVVIDGKQMSDRFILTRREVVIGRDSDVDIIFNDGRVSRRHAKITWENIENETEDPQCRVDDLQSRNGTMVNGQRIRTQSLRDGDRIMIGTTLVGYYIKDDQELSLDQKLLTMATTDSLTGLANRLFFQTEARREIHRAARYGRPLSIIVIDLDHFKYVNDTFGHAAGDTVLRQLARIIVVTMREGDVIGRVGGEEFAVLLPETNLDGAVASAERLRQRVGSHVFRHQDTSIQVTISLGVAQHSAQYSKWEAFFEAADKALYEAKANGRNQTCHALYIP